MAGNSHQPRLYDAVLGGQISVPAYAAVLGGLEGVKQRCASKVEQHRIAALSNAMKYGQEGLDLVVAALKDESEQVQLTAYKLLRARPELSFKQVLQEFNPYRFFECLHTLNGIRGKASPITFSPDEQTIVSCDSHTRFGNLDGTGDSRLNCQAWNLNTGEPLPALYDLGESVTFGSSDKDYLHSLIISPDHQMLIAAGTEYRWLGDTRIDVLNLYTGQKIHTLYGHSRWGTDKQVAIAVSQDGRILVTGSQDKTAIAWDLQADRKLYTLRGHTGAVTSVAISLDGQTLVTGSQDKTIKLWNLATGKELGTWRSHASSVTSVTLSSDGQTLVSGDRTGSIKIWDLNTGIELLALDRGSEVGFLTISLDRRILVSCGRGRQDSPINVWAIKTGKLLATLKDTSNTMSAAISTDGQTIVTHSDDAIKVWGLP